MTSLLRDLLEMVVIAVVVFFGLSLGSWLLEDPQTNFLWLLTGIGVFLMALMMVPWTRYLALLGGAIAFGQGISWLQADTARRREEARHAEHRCPVCRRRYQHRPDGGPSPHHGQGVEQDYDVDSLPYNRRE
jgi:hypothetical protein